ncbi:hypothetical protein M0Q50_02780 [bacterium]|jgi:hypothetical protein|nr:hypothetical protein [bacterium]
MKTTEDYLKEAKNLFYENLSNYFDVISDSFEDAESFSSLCRIREESLWQITRTIKFPVELFNKFAAKALEKVKTIDEKYLLFDIIDGYKHPNIDTEKIKNTLIEDMCEEINEWDQAYKTYHRIGYQKKFLCKMVELAETERQVENTSLCVNSVSYIDLKEIIKEKRKRFPNLEKKNTKKTTLLPIKVGR